MVKSGGGKAGRGGGGGGGAGVNHPDTELTIGEFYIFQ